MDIREESLKKHYEWGGKIEVVSRVKINERADLSLDYTPGVAEPCLAIKDDYNKSWELTRRSNLVAVVTDGTAVLGLGILALRRECLLWRANARSSRNLPVLMHFLFACAQRTLTR